jgi:FlaA1/EpsC-like NDP-sugar epimerase
VYLDGATVLVTGAAGSIGRELCLRLAGTGAARLVLVDQSEAPLVGLADDLAGAGVDVLPLLADVRSLPRALDVLERHRPDVVFHAAAYKHVPLLEEHPVEAAATNVLGTVAIVTAAKHAGVERLVLFSTDKAVEPTSVLGLTKAAAELIVASAGRECGAAYTSIRLGNVVDTAGSVVSRFRRQLEDGGVLTITDPRATRYLMTAGEAAQLAIAAGRLAGPDAVFWLDCGRPVPIVELGLRLARAYGVDPAIELVGLRPGERLHELLCREGDEATATAVPRVMRSPAVGVDPLWLQARVEALARHVDEGSPDGVLATLSELHDGAPVPATVTAAL